MFKIRPVIAEFVGTFFFIFIGAGAIVVNQSAQGALGAVGIALAQGLTLAVLISAFGPVSGGHFNPAVTAGLFIVKKIGRPTAIAYVIVQLLGGILAGFLLRAIFPTAVWEAAYLGAPHLATGLSIVSALILEIVLTFFFLLAFLGTSVDSMAPKTGGLGAGMAYAAAWLLGGPLTGAAMNPARAFGPALAANYWDAHWIYWIGPLIGAGLACWLYTRWISETI
jgi:MIP family channel proteins